MKPDKVKKQKTSWQFKYTQSFNKKALQQAITYDYLYRQSKQLADNELQTVMLSAKSPRTDTLEQLFYFKTKSVGVYHSNHPIFERILLLSLNELSNAPCNAWIK